MNKRTWKTKIKKACRAVDTYKPEFDYVIDTLAGILERRDDVAAAYEENPRPVIEYTNKNDSTNQVKNPLLVLIEDMDKAALAYWRDLGLTPAGLRKINERTFKDREDKPDNSLIGRLMELRKARGLDDGGV